MFSDKHYIALILFLAGILMIGLGSLRFCGDFDLPGKPVKPAVEIDTAANVSQRITRSALAYDGYLEKDSANFGLSRVQVRTMSAVFPYQASHERHVLAPDESIEVNGLVLTMKTPKKRGKRQMTLTIENKTHKAMAYRIKTRPSPGARSCRRMKHLPHNAIALPPRGLITRGECTYRKGWTLEVLEVETVALPELAYLYVSSVPVETFGFDKRTSGKHKSPSPGLSCRAIASATFRKSVASGDIGWRDLVDFYARHRCNSYKLPVGYTAFEKNDERVLPVTETDL
jgi:hypothetical protein